VKLPPPFNWLWKGWNAFSHVLGFVMSKIILTIVWIVGFGIYAIIIKLFLIRKLMKKKPETYWIDIKQDPIENMKYQF